MTMSITFAMEIGGKINKHIDKHKWKCKVCFVAAQEKPIVNVVI